jgi:hypothetical protein
MTTSFIDDNVKLDSNKYHSIVDYLKEQNESQQKAIGNYQKQLESLKEFSKIENESFEKTLLELRASTQLNSLESSKVMQYFDDCSFLIYTENQYFLSYLITYLVIFVSVYVRICLSLLLIDKLLLVLRDLLSTFMYESRCKR